MRLHFYSLIVSRARHCVMSIRIMGAVWERQDITSTQKLVLLALADWANDEGHCWPSIDRLCKKSCLKRRSVQNAIRDLENMGIIRREEITGKGCKYWIDAPVQEMHPRIKCTPPVQEMRPTRALNAPNTLDIHQDTSDLMSETPVSDADDTIDVNDVMHEWNDIAANLGKPKVRDLTPERRQLLKARLAQYKIEDFVTVFDKIERSAFLRGDTGWSGCTFDWVFKKGNFQKILEGNYDK